MNEPSSHRGIVLASTSPYRRRLLERLGIDIKAISPRCDEDAYPDLPPLELARTLARIKATSLDENAVGDALVIGSDQVVDLEGEVLGKPGSVERACGQLRRLSGRSHRLITAVAVHDLVTGQTHEDVDIHVLTMRELTDAQIRGYVAADTPLGCAGSYTIERRGIALFSTIEADPQLADNTAIEGLPLMRTLRLLRRHGWDVLQSGEEAL